MDYLISGLPLQPLQPLFLLDDAGLRERGIVRVPVDAKPGFPCRVTLQDAEPGDSVLLLSWRHLDVATPYRADGPIFVSESARATAVWKNAIPEQQRSRLLSVRAYDAEGWLQDAEVVDGAELEPLIERCFSESEIDYLHVHNARRGCYMCRVDRA